MHCKQQALAHLPPTFFCFHFLSHVTEKQSPGWMINGWMDEKGVGCFGGPLTAIKSVQFELLHVNQASKYYNKVRVGMG
jgi:hypothetical protein